MSEVLLPIPAKKSPRSNHKFVTFMYKLGQCMTGNEFFSSPTPTGPALTSAAAGLAAANATAKNGGTAAVAAREALRTDSEELVNQLVAYVRATVNAQAGDASTAVAMIESSGLSVHKTTKTNKPELAAKYGTLSGETLLVARAVAKSAVYLWEFSLDQRSWTSVPQTMKATTTVSGLTPGQVYYFRFRAQTRKKGIGDYSQVVSLMMH